ncbi:MAG: GNAT family N-acetyltransferase [Fimbriimonas sp.]
MTEIRPIRETEAEPFLQLLCDVFNLDYNRAYDVFFSEPMFDLQRKWALFEGAEMVSILTTTPLTFGWGNAIGIAGVATRVNRQREGHASRLLQRVFRESERRGEGPALLFAREAELYERNGFEPLDRIIRAKVILDPEEITDPMEQVDIERLYNEWSAAHPDRLRRDARRWNYWRWHYRLAAPFRDGYVCHEPGVLREALYTGQARALPLAPDTEFLGSTFIADLLELPLTDPTVDLYLMGRNVPGIPQMFMTDQF